VHHDLPQYLQLLDLGPGRSVDDSAHRVFNTPFRLRPIISSSSASI